MPEVRGDGVSEEASRNVASVVWGLLLIWTGAALFLHWGWGLGLLGAGVVLVGAQAFRHHQRLKVDGFGLVAGVVLLLCGIGSLAGIAVDLVPLLFVVAGVALLLSTWTAHRRAPGGRPDLPAQAPPRP